MKLSSFLASILPTLFTSGIILMLYNLFFANNLFSFYSSEFLFVLFAIGLAVIYALNFTGKKQSFWFSIAFLSIAVGVWISNYPLITSNRNFLKAVFYMFSVFGSFGVIMKWIWFNDSFSYFRIYLSTIFSVVVITLVTQVLNLIFPEFEKDVSLLTLLKNHAIWTFLSYSALHFGDHLVVMLDDRLNLDLFEYEKDVDWDEMEDE